MKNAFNRGWDYGYVPAAMSYQAESVIRYNVEVRTQYDVEPVYAFGELLGHAIRVRRTFVYDWGDGTATATASEQTYFQVR